jgi:hypothetical protein
MFDIHMARAGLVCTGGKDGCIKGWDARQAGSGPASVPVFSIKRLGSQGAMLSVGSTGGQGPAQLLTGELDKYITNSDTNANTYNKIIIILIIKIIVVILIAIVILILILLLLVIIMVIAITITVVVTIILITFFPVLRPGCAFRPQYPQHISWMLGSQEHNILIYL